MDPKTALSAAAFGLDTMRTIQQGQAQAAQARRTAELGRQQADLARQTAAIEADGFRRDASARLAALRARGAGSGLASAGTPLLAALATADDAAFEEAQIRARGAQRAAGLAGAAELDDWRAGTIARDTMLSVGTSLMRTAASWPAGTPSRAWQTRHNNPRNPRSHRP